MTVQDQTIHVQQLFVRHQSAIKAFVLALVPQFSEAEDVLQETFLTVTAKAEDFRADSNFLAWACSIARLKVLESHRRNARLHLSADAIEALASSVPEGLFDEQRLKALADCLDKLSPRQRQLMELRYEREQTPTAIAGQLERTLNSVNVALAKARIAVRDCVERALRRQEST